MKIVGCDITLVPVSSLVPGSTFRYGSDYYVSTCAGVRKQDIWGINLENGNFITSASTVVEPVVMEARVL
jgi:hypothetical protein